MKSPERLKHIIVHMSECAVSQVSEHRLDLDIDRLYPEHVGPRSHRCDNCRSLSSQAATAVEAAIGLNHSS
jgi:hypothetical protein